MTTAEDVERATKKNTTGLKTLDRLERDARVVRVWSEDEDGYWAELAPGFNFDGCSCLHEYTARALLAAAGRIEKGEPC